MSGARTIATDPAVAVERGLATVRGAESPEVARSIADAMLSLDTLPDGVRARALTAHSTAWTAARLPLPTRIRSQPVAPGDIPGGGRDGKVGPH